MAERDRWSASTSHKQPPHLQPTNQQRPQPPRLPAQRQNHQPPLSPKIQPLQAQTNPLPKLPAPKLQPKQQTEPPLPREPTLPNQHNPPSSSSPIPSPSVAALLNKPPPQP
ncbi:cell wall protein [Histoplasma capsulatum]|uniref:Cell wall protein n=1 Tax=Ajellomyces capsulatus TaxID=5037 RepID=A0A8A1M4L9_AJECA|nr:cell wall protein [Histoplasma capsulatum]